MQRAHFCSSHCSCILHQGVIGQNQKYSLEKEPGLIFLLFWLFFLFTSVLQSQSILADFGSHVPVEKGPTSASSLVSYWEKGAMGLLATLNQGRSVYLEALFKPSLSRSSGQYEPCPDRPVSVSVVNHGPILGFVPAAFEALQATMKQRG